MISSVVGQAGTSIASLPDAAFGFAPPAEEAPIEHWGRSSYEAGGTEMKGKNDAKWLAAKSQKASTWMNLQFNFRLDQKNRKDFVDFMETPEVRDVILSNRFARFWDSMAATGKPLAFDLSSASVYVDLLNDEEATLDVLRKLKEAYDFTLVDDDLATILDLRRYPDVMEALLAEPCREGVVGRLKDERGYAFSVRDVWILLYLADHPGEMDQLYHADVDALARHAFGDTPGNDLFERFEIARLLADDQEEETRAFMSSDSCPKAIRRLTGMGSSFVPGLRLMQLEGIAATNDLPKALAFLKGIRGLSLDTPALPLHLPELAELAQDERAIGLVKKLNALKDKKSKASFRFAVGDGSALASLLQDYSPDEIVGETQRLLAWEKGTLSGNDLSYFMQRGDAFAFDRQELADEIRADVADDTCRRYRGVRRYGSYNDPTKFSLVDLNKAAQLKRWLAQPEAQVAISALVRKDLDEYPANELGGLIFVGEEPVIAELTPRMSFDNSYYRVPREVFASLSRSIAEFHLHAVEEDFSRYSGPSLGDLTVASSINIDGVVITPMGPGRFCVHFYDTNDNVLFLGAYDVDHIS